MPSPVDLDTTIAPIDTKLALQLLADARADMYAAPHVAARLTLEAAAAGMPLRSARRWPRYLAHKARRQEEPITLSAAVDQCRTARLDDAGCSHTCSCTSDLECPHDCDCGGRR